MPTIARLHGHVLGGALELVLGCDLRMAAASCRLGMPEITVGIPSVIQAALLPGLIGWGRTAELLLGGRPIEATEAERWGLVNRAVDDDALDREVEGWVDRLLALPPRCAPAPEDAPRRAGAAWIWTRPSPCRSTCSPARMPTGEPRRAMQAFLDRPPVPGLGADAWTLGRPSPSSRACGC